ncbi:xylulokinase [Roseivirga misakiensis]|uniref:Carbohydrate kinase n=1 Tax=Roseivirga misakiensis TaxID=1563681 RepID=A0A1E5T7Z7_9BACT|nr:FGGY family carbohydrate kinase [Roseivirga misakiensis]OEK07502.1 carbohydrate kinase [Roseivirga misakiensis]
MYFLGYDIGSSSIKAALVDAKTLEEISVAKYPEKEMPIQSDKEGWAEQNPEEWWDNLISVTNLLLEKARVNRFDISAIGIAYQMHGLVLVDRQQQVLRPAIIWCDSRAVSIGQTAKEQLGEAFCLNHLLNTPGNFTASKLSWVKENEPGLYKKIYKFMLPGDFIGMKMTDEIVTTIGGLSEGIFWDFKEKRVSKEILDQFGIESKLVPEVVVGIGIQGKLSSGAAEILGLKPNIPIAYRAGDQPNNAMALNVLKPGEIAATGGTSGVIYGISKKPLFDLKSRVNGFAHVNYTQENGMIGILLCINGAGIQYSWTRSLLGEQMSYEQIEQVAATVPIGANGLSFLPFGNGAERIFENRMVGAHMSGIDLNRHSKPDIFRATIEGIAFAFVYGARIMREMGLTIDKIRVGNDNLFQSEIFSKTIAVLLHAKIEIYETTGASGAAKAAGVGAGFIDSIEEAMSTQKIIKTVLPDDEITSYQMAFNNWEKALEKQLKN